MSENAWIFVTDRQNWRDCVEEGSFGLKSMPGRIEHADPGDPFLAYVKGECLFAGFGEIKSKNIKIQDLITSHTACG